MMIENIIVAVALMIIWSGFINLIKRWNEENQRIKKMEKETEERWERILKRQSKWLNWEFADNDLEGMYQTGGDDDL